MPVDSTCKDYDDIKDKWSLVRSIVNNDAKKLIRIVDKNDPVRSDQYRNDAILTNFTRLTKVGLTGLVFRKDPTINIAPGLEYLLDDATGYGFGLTQFSQQATGEVLMTGRYGILVDMPQRKDDSVDADQGMTRFKPYMAESIINWRYEEFGAEYKPVLVVLKEQIKVITDDIFEPCIEDQYRVLTLTKNQVYQQWVYDKDCKILPGYPITPTDYHGNPFNEIPFVFMGSENNDGTMDPIPLYDLAIVNLGHYRNSADLEESIFIVGQPFLVVDVGETSTEEFKQANPNGLMFGSRGGLILAAGGNAHLLQANANQMVSEQMKEKVVHMAGLGARIVQAVVGRETAEAARIRYGAQNSALYMLTINISLAIEKALELVAQCELESMVESEFKLNDEFYDDTADAAVIAQEILLLDRNAMTVDELRANLIRVGELPADAGDVPSKDVINPLDAPAAPNVVTGNN